MSEYELTELLGQHVELLMTFFMAYVSVTSAFLAAICLVGDSVSRFLVNIVFVLYTSAALFLIFTTFQVGGLVHAIQGEMRGVLDWHPAAVEVPWLVPAAVRFLIGLMVAIYLSCIAYFFHARLGESGHLVSRADSSP
ncbi:MAG: hypothetical protein V7696_19705 [Halioglobus sp.]